MSLKQNTCKYLCLVNAACLVRRECAGFFVFCSDASALRLVVTDAKVAAKTVTSIRYDSGQRTLLELGAALLRKYKTEKQRQVLRQKR